MAVNMDPDARCCWTCTYQQTGGSNFLGWCRWFTVHQNVGAKEIPSEVVDVGCGEYERKESL